MKHFPLIGRHKHSINWRVASSVATWQSGLYVLITHVLCCVVQCLARFVLAGLPYPFLTSAVHVRACMRAIQLAGCIVHFYMLTQVREQRKEV